MWLNVLHNTQHNVFQYDSINVTSIISSYIPSLLAADHRVFQLLSYTAKKIICIDKAAPLPHGVYVSVPLYCHL